MECVYGKRWNVCMVCPTSEIEEKERAKESSFKRKRAEKTGDDNNACTMLARKHCIHYTRIPMVRELTTMVPP